VVSRFKGFDAASKVLKFLGFNISGLVGRILPVFIYFKEEIHYFFFKFLITQVVRAYGLLALVN
jgi:hypothetical protein